MRAGRAVALVVTVVLAATAAVALWGASYDDAWITYRYADNLARGDGLTFNPGERVLGTTAPGWAVVLGLAARWTPIAVPEWGTLLSVLSLAVIGGLLPLLAAREAPPPWPWAFPLALALLTFTSPWHLTLLGAETLPVLALGGSAALVALAPAGPAGPRRQVAAGLLMAAAMVLRADAALGALAVGLVLWGRRRRHGAAWTGLPWSGLPWIYGLAGVLPVLPWLAVLWAKFGAVLPTTLAGKRSEASPAGWAEHWWGYTAAEGRWLLRDLPAGAAVVVLLLALAGAVFLVRRLIRGATPPPWGGLAAALAGWVALHEVAYRAVGVPFAPWYHLHLLQAVLALAAAGALALGLAVAAPRRVLAVGTAAALLLPVLLPGAVWLAAHDGVAPDARTVLYARVGRWLARESPPGATVAAVEVGALGYHADRPVLDLMGLVTPAAREARRQGRLPELVAERRPEYLLVPPHFLPGLLAPVVARVGADYEPVATFRHRRYGGGPVTLYRLRAAVVSPPSASDPDSSSSGATVRSDSNSS